MAADRSSTGGRWRRGSHLPGVRGRVSLLLLVAAVPPLLLAVATVWQNYRLAAAVPLERAAILRAAVAAGYDTVLDDAGPFLTGVAAAPDLAVADPASCATALARALDHRGERFANLSVLDPSGHIRCSLHPVAWPRASAADSACFRALRAGGRMDCALPDQTTPAGRLLLLAAMPRGDTDRFAGVVAAEVRMVRPAGKPWAGPASPGDHAWLIDAEDRMVPLDPAPPSALPRAGVLRRLLGGGAAVLAGRSREGRAVAYAMTPLDGGLRLLVGTDSTRDAAIAQAALWWRLAALALLLAAGLAAVALGANFALAQPIKRLSAAVQAWRGGAQFDAGPHQGMPLELRQLADSFSAAASALAEREQQLQLAVQQQELLMQEIHHRVKNNLQIIASLLNLQANRIKLPEARREFAAARDRIRALATLHRHLYAHGDLHTIIMGRFLRELCDQLLAAMGEPADGRIRLDIDAPAVQITSDQAVPMALIVTEAVSNAARYAFPGGRSGHIQVTLETAGSEARLVIEDDGVGFPDGPAETESGMRDGLGLHLIRGFARQLGGRLTLTREAGTRYVLELTLRRDRDAAEEPDPQATPG